ncbi:MAG: GntR family transcriptional regulator [Gemmatimonadales bacterium]
MIAYRTKSDLVYEALRTDLMAGRYPPGTRIIVDQLAAELGTSKVPVREAVGRLVGEGWLQARAHAGAIVPELQPDEILETSVIRAAIEGAAIRHSVPNLQLKTVQQLEKLLDAMDAASRKNDGRYPELNFEFHSSAFSDCCYPALRAMARSLAERSLRLRTVRFLPEYESESQLQHRALLAAMRRGAAEESERLVRHHIEHAGRLLSEYALEQHRTGPLPARRRN